MGTFLAAAFVKYATWSWSYRFNVSVEVIQDETDVLTYAGHRVCGIRPCRSLIIQPTTNSHSPEL